MILFFVRRYNDIDHTVPIIYRMAKDGFRDVEILCTNAGIDLDTDFRLAFLNKSFGISPRYATHFFWPTRFQDQIRAFATSGLYYRRSIKNRSASKAVIALVKKRLEYTRTNLLVFDWQHADKSFLTSCILTASKDLGIPNICLPHGLALNTNDDWISSPNHKGGQIPVEGISWSYFDDFVFQYEDEGHCRLARNHVGILPHKTHVLGSTRFCREWRKVYEGLFQVQNQKLPNRGKLKVVYMDHFPSDRLRGSVIAETMKQILSLDYVDLVIKPSTASVERQKGGVSSSQLIDLGIVDYQTSSFELCKWADVVIGVNSSILLEPLLMGKTFIFARYFSENEQLWDKMNACWTINSEEKLIDALRDISLNRTYRPYSQHCVDTFINHVVYNGLPERDVLGEYCDLIFRKRRIMSASS